MFNSYWLKDKSKRPTGHSIAGLIHMQLMNIQNMHRSNEEVRVGRRGALLEVKGMLDVVVHKPHTN